MFLWTIFLLIPVINAGLHDERSRIAGGKNASIEMYSYMISLQYKGVHICGAFRLIGNVAATAAQCLYGLPVEDLSVRIGSNLTDRGGNVYNIYDINIHPKYNPRSLDYDEAAFNIKDYNPPKKDISAFSLPEPDMENTNLPIFTGWGRKQEGGPLSNQLLVTEIALVDFKVCNHHYKRLTNRMMCAGSMAGFRGPCDGDQGGPLIQNKTLLGWFSFSYGCSQPNFPGVFTKFLPDQSILSKYLNKFNK